MKKKILAIMTALACTATCATALVACGDDEIQKHHSEAQWKAAFNAALDTPNFKLQQNYLVDSGYAGMFDLYYDSVKQIYIMNDYFDGTAESTTFLFKKGAKCFMGDTSALAEEITAEDFAGRVSYLDEYYASMADMLLEKYRDSYGKFVTYGGNGETNGVKYYNYVLKNSKFTIEGSIPDATAPDGYKKGDIEYSVESIQVDITTSGELYKITMDGITNEYDENTLEFVFNQGSGAQEMLDQYSMRLPEVFGTTYEFVDVTVNPNIESLLQQAGAMRQLYQGKRISCAADGSLSGDVEVDGTSITEFKLTESNGQITVTGGGYTLHGECKADKNMGEILLKLNNTIQSGNDEIVFTFILKRVYE